MEEHQVVPDVIDIVPKDVIKVTYENGVVDMGKELTPTDVKDQPSVTYPADSEAYYTLIMTDPDAPSRENPINGEVKHWLVVNIPGSNVENGEVIAEYRGSGPPLGSGLHRYIFLVFKQTGKLTFDEPTLSKSSREGRRKFKTRDFAKKYNLGNPVAGNFFQAQYDDYVRKLQEQTIAK